jgi:hypothetical protein
MATLTIEMATDGQAALDRLTARVDSLESFLADRDRRLLDCERALTIAADAIGSLTRLHMTEGIAERVESGMRSIRQRVGLPAVGMPAA